MRSREPALPTPSALRRAHSSAVRRSCQTIARWIGSPVARSQTTTVSRWLVMPIAATRLASTLASASRRDRERVAARSARDRARPARARDNAAEARAARLRLGARFAVEQDGARRRRALIDRQDMIRPRHAAEHRRRANAPGRGSQVQAGCLKRGLACTSKYKLMRKATDFALRWPRMGVRRTYVGAHGDPAGFLALLPRAGARISERACRMCSPTRSSIPSRAFHGARC